MKQKTLNLIAKSTFLFFIGMILVKLFNLAYRIIISRFLGVEGYGFFSLVFAIFNTAAIIAVMGINYCLSMYIPYYAVKKEQAKVRGIIFSSIGITLITSVLAGCVLFFGADFIAMKMHSLALVPLLKVAAFGVPFYTLFLNLQKVMEGFKVVKYSITVEAVYSVLRVLTVVFFLAIGSAIMGAVVSYVVSTIFAAVIAFGIINKKLIKLTKIKEYDSSMLKKVLFYFWPLLLTNIMVPLMSWTDTLFLGYFKNPHEVGLYNAAVQMGGLLVIVLTGFNSILLPLMAEAYAKRDMHEMRRIYYAATRWILLITLPILLIFVFFAQTILALTFGGDFGGASRVFIILSCGFFATTFLGVSNGILYSIEKTKVVLANTVLVFILSIVLNIVLIPRYGMIGAALGTAFASIFINSLRALQVKKILHIHPININLAKPVLAGVIAIIGALGISEYYFSSVSPIINFIIAIIIFLVLYLLLLVVLKSFQEEDKVILRMIRKRTGVRIGVLDRFIGD